MARRTKFNSLDRQTYRLGRSILRQTQFPELSETPSPASLRSRGMRDEEIAAFFNCPVEEIDQLIAFDLETAKVSASADKDFVKELAKVDMVLSESEINVTIIKSGNKSSRGRKDVKH